MTFKADWLIGEGVIPTGGYAYKINGSDYGIAAGNYYLYDSTGTRSMLQQLEDDLATEGITNASVFMTEAGFVRITGDVNFAIIWTDSGFRDLLGWQATIASTQAATAPLKSPLFWSPGYPATPANSPGGVIGDKIYDTAITASPDGSTMQATRHHTQNTQQLTWNMVPSARVWTTDENGLGGEFRKFYDDVLSKGYRCKHHVLIDEGTGTTDVTASLASALGPYKIPRTFDGWWNRSIAMSDTRSAITIDLMKTAEIG